jgi:hypothetical protein
MGKSSLDVFLENSPKKWAAEKPWRGWRDWRCGFLTERKNNNSKLLRKPGLRKATPPTPPTWRGDSAHGRRQRPIASMPGMAGIGAHVRVAGHGRAAKSCACQSICIRTFEVRPFLVPTVLVGMLSPDAPRRGRPARGGGRDGTQSVQTCVPTRERGNEERSKKTYEF